jgi:hypothetical protein
MQITQWSFRFGSEILDAPAFAPRKQDILEVFTNIQNVPQLAVPKTRTRGNQTFTFPTNQIELNNVIAADFVGRGWQRNPPITNDNISRINADFLRDRVIVEVQFGNMSRWYADVFKFQLAVSRGNVDVGVCVVPMKAFADTIDENVAYYQRVIRELGYASNSVAVPIWVLGVEP